MSELTSDRLEIAMREVVERGYTILERIVPEGMIDGLVAAIDDLKAKEVGCVKNESVTAFKGSSTHRLRNLVSRGSVFEEAAAFEPVNQVAEKLLGPGFLVFASAVVEVGPGEAPQRIHTDDILIRLPRPLPLPLIINSIWALSDFTESNGATRLVPHSHTLNHLPPRDYTEPSVPAVMEKGSILIYHGSMWHGAGRNTTEAEWRLGMTISYCASFIRPYENQLKLIDLQRARNLSPKMRVLIGYEYSIPENMQR